MGQDLEGCRHDRVGVITHCFHLVLEGLKVPYVLYFLSGVWKIVSAIGIHVGLEMPLEQSKWERIMARIEHWQSSADIVTTMQKMREILSGVQGRVKVGSRREGHGRGELE